MWQVIISEGEKKKPQNIMLSEKTLLQNAN